MAKQKIDPNILNSLAQQNEREQSKETSGPILALDWGEKFCGLAWTPDGSVCLPYGTFSRTQIMDKINNLVQEKKPTKLIIGLPISGDGHENHICQAIREFAKKEITIPYEFCNERGSSQATLTPNKEDRIDDLAAAHILERYLQQQLPRA